MKVSNQNGRIFDVSKEEYDNLVEMGVRLNIMIRELEEIVKTDNCVYTAICGEYLLDRSDITCYKGDNIFTKDVMEAKRYKILPHLFFPEREVTIWTDANVFLKAEPDYIISKYLKDADIAIFRHSYRDTVYQEFDELKKDPRFNDPWLQKRLREQEEHYKKQGLPGEKLYECNFIIRRNNERVNALMNAWWAEICRWTWRDQVSFPYVLWKYGKGVRLNEYKENIRDSKFFKHIETHGN